MTATPGRVAPFTGVEMHEESRLPAILRAADAGATGQDGKRVVGAFSSEEDSDGDEGCSPKGAEAKDGGRRRGGQALPAYSGAATGGVAGKPHDVRARLRPGAGRRRDGAVTG